MPVDFNTYVLNKFIVEISEQGYKPDVLETNLWKYRYICYKLNHFIKYVPLPSIKKRSFYEAVFIEFRILPNIEFVIRNAILKLGSEWSFTIICGVKNYKYMCDMASSISRNINVIKLDYENLTQEEYSVLLTMSYFWEGLYGEKILIYQEDSLIFHNNIGPFLKYDFIGAPFSKSSNDTPNGVGNGGFSLRTKIKMLEVIKSCKLEDTIPESSTVAYMKMKNLKYVPEDVYFSKNMQEKHIGEVADWDTAREFSVETVFNAHSLGGHQFWHSNSDWQKHMQKIFNYSKYNPKSNLNKYLYYKDLPQDFNKNDQIKNAFDIDLKFFCYVNNIKYVNDKVTLEYIQNIGLDGFIYHPKQLFNIIDRDISLYSFLNNLYVFKSRTIYTIQDFITRYIYNSNFDYLADLLIKKKYDTLNDNYDTYLLVFLGNDEVAVDLLSKIILYKEINSEFNIAFCINKNSIKNSSKVKNMIKENFDFYAIYYSKEFGTDITPTLLMYNDIVKKHKVKHILKFHTKTINDLYEKLTNYLLENTLENVIRSKRANCNCICDPKCYILITADNFNNILKIRHINVINMDYYFVGGTIFYTTNYVFDKVLDFMKTTNYRSYLLNNLYENNMINHEFSPIHFLERLFGTIKL